MGTFLMAKGLFNIARWGWIVIALVGFALIVWAIIGTYDNTLDDARKVSREAGEAGAVMAGQAQTLNQLGDANAAEQDLRSTGERSPKRHDDCLRDSRDKGSCERYDPDAPAQ